MSPALGEAGIAMARADGAGVALRDLGLEVMAGPVRMLVVGYGVQAHDPLPIGIGEPMVFRHDEEALRVFRLRLGGKSQQAGPVSYAAERFLPRAELQIGFPDIGMEADEIHILQPVLGLVVREAEPLDPFLGRRHPEILEALVEFFLHGDGHQEAVLLVLAHGQQFLGVPRREIDALEIPFHVGQADVRLALHHPQALLDPLAVLLQGDRGIGGRAAQPLAMGFGKMRLQQGDAGRVFFANVRDVPEACMGQLGGGVLEHDVFRTLLEDSAGSFEGRDDGLGLVFAVGHRVAHFARNAVDRVLHVETGIGLEFAQDVVFEIDVVKLRAQQQPVDLVVHRPSGGIQSVQAGSKFRQPRGLSLDDGGEIGYFIADGVGTPGSPPEQGASKCPEFLGKLDEFRGDVYLVLCHGGECHHCGNKSSGQGQGDVTNLHVRFSSFNCFRL